MALPTLLFLGTMKREELKEKITGLIEPVMSSLDVELDNLEINKMGRKMLMRVFIEKKGGVTIDDCERVSREIEAVLDVEDPIAGPYVLEVSSPGLDRPLKKPGDFIRYTGRKVRVVTRDPVENQTFFIGSIDAATDDDVVLLLQQEKRVTIPYANISRARLEVEV